MVNNSLVIISLIISIISIILSLLIIFILYRTNLYINNIEDNQDEMMMTVLNNQQVLENSIKEDYLIKTDKKIKIKKPKI